MNVNKIIKNFKKELLAEADPSRAKNIIRNLEYKNPEIKELIEEIVLKRFFKN